MKRRDFCKGVGMAVGVGGLVASYLSPVQAQVGRLERGDRDPEEVSAQVGRIYQLQAAFHWAKTTQDIDLMMSLWDVDGILNIQGDPNSPYIGSDRLKSFWLSSGSFTHRRFSLVPSFKTQIEVHGHRAFLYFECHDVGNFDLADRSIASDTFLAGTVRKMDDRWVFSEMTAGKAFPLSVDHYYFP